MTPVSFGMPMPIISDRKQLQNRSTLNHRESQPKFGNDDDPFNSSAFDDTTSDYGSTQPVDYSKRTEKKEPRKPLRSREGYKKFHDVAAYDLPEIGGGFLGLSLFVGAFAGLFGLVAYGTVNNTDPGIGDDTAVLHRYDLKDTADDIEENIGYLRGITNEEASNTINQQMMKDVYAYLETADIAFQTETHITNNFSLSDIATNLDAEQQAEFETLVEEWVDAENLDDLRMISNTLIENYLMPQVAATEPGQDDIDAALYQKTINDFFDSVDNEALAYEIPFTAAKGAALVAVLSLFSLAGVLLPKPKYN